MNRLLNKNFFLFPYYLVDDIRLYDKRVETPLVTIVQNKLSRLYPHVKELRSQTIWGTYR